MSNFLWAALLLAAAVPAEASAPCSGENQAEVSSELLALYQADQADRASNDPKVAKNDQARISRVTKLDARGSVCTPLNMFHAAWVLKRSQDAKELERAYQLAQEAMQHHVTNAPWVTATVFDRWRVVRGLPQRYGSMLGVQNGRQCLYAVAEDVPDAERAQYGLPPLTDQIQRVLDGAGLGEPYTLRELERRKLMCDPMGGKRR